MKVEAPENEILVTLTAEIASAHLSQNSVDIEEIPGLIAKVYAALANLGEEVASKDELPDPAVSVRASVKKDRLVCLDCGKKMKMLKRHLASDHDLTPDEYRQRWGLPTDYPMVAAEYAETRRAIAKETGLGRKPGQRRGRKKG